MLNTLSILLEFHLLSVAVTLTDIMVRIIGIAQLHHVIATAQYFALLKALLAAQGLPKRKSIGCIVATHNTVGVVTGIGGVCV